MTAPELTATLLANGPYVRADAPFRLLEVRGPDAGEFVHRLCSQEVEGLSDGVVAPASFLDAKGKVQATCLVFRFGEAIWLELQAPQAERLHELLERYHFTEKLQIELHPAGPVSERVAAAADAAPTAVQTGASTTITYERRGVQFVREHGGAASEGEPLTAELAECLRMCSGMVQVGVETEASTLALEADLDDHCSTTKGCYTGQEIVARIHTYGKVNRKLCLLRLAAGDAITEPATLEETEDEIPVGRVMHAVPSPDASFRLGLGYLPTDFQAVGTKLQLEEGAEVEVVGF